MKVERQEDKQKLPNSTGGRAGPGVIPCRQFSGIGIRSKPGRLCFVKGGFAWTHSNHGRLDAGIRKTCQHGMVSPGHIKATHENRSGDENGEDWDMGKDGCQHSSIPPSRNARGYHRGLRVSSWGWVRDRTEPHCRWRCFEG